MDTLESLIPIIAIVCGCALPIVMAAVVLVKLINANSRERIELARHGIVAPARSKPSPNKYRSLRNGILCIGIAIGLIIGIIINSNFIFRDYIKFTVISSSTILCLGLSYVIFYLIAANKNPENEE